MPLKPAVIQCLNEGPDCRGPVRFRLRASDWKSFPRCEHHHALRQKLEERINSRYGGVSAPSDFDPSYAGERWDEDDA